MPSQRGGVGLMGRKLLFLALGVIGEAKYQVEASAWLKIGLKTQVRESACAY